MTPDSALRATRPHVRQRLSVKCARDLVPTKNLAAGQEIPARRSVLLLPGAFMVLVGQESAARES